MTRFTPETRQLIAQEVTRRQEEGTIESYETPVESALLRFRERAQELHKEQFALDEVLSQLVERWRAVQESGGSHDLEARLDAYMAEGERIERWLKLTEEGSVREREHGSQRDVIKNIQPTDPDKWKKLFWGLRRLGGVQGSGKFYSPDELISLITGVRNGSERMSKITSGGDLGLHDIVATFIQADAGETKGQVRDSAPNREQEMTPELVGKQLRRLSMADPDKWQKLYALLRSARGLQGSKIYFPAEHLISAIEAARRDPAGQMARVTEGGIRLNEHVMRFIAFDASRERGLELNGFRPGDRVVHPFSHEKTTVTFVGNQIVDFIPPAYLAKYQKSDGRNRVGGYQVLKHSPEFFVLRGNTRFVLAGERAVQPSAEIESPTDLENRTMVVPLDSLMHAS